MQYPGKKITFLRSALWLGLTCIVFFCLVKLSFWQYNRGIDKEMRMIKIAELNQQSPLTLDEILKFSQEKQVIGDESINDFPVTISGEFNNDYIFLLDNQVEKNSLGYRVMQVVETPTHTVLVNLGWIQGSINRSLLPEVPPITGLHTFQGHVRIVDQGMMLTQQDFTNPSWPLRVQQIELSKFSTLINKPLLPFVIYVNKEESVGYKKNWHPIVMPPEKHFGYAFQWASLAIAWLILMVYLRIKTQRELALRKYNLTNTEITPN